MVCPIAVRDDIRAAMEKTANNTGMTLIVALNYGGRAEIVDAVNSAIVNSQKNAVPDQPPQPIDEEMISRHLYTAGLPDPDLLIRTSGEMRVSNFLLWQIAYAEIYVTETLWPDFDDAELHRALLEFQSRERRYGGLSSEDSSPDPE